MTRFTKRHALILAPPLLLATTTAGFQLLTRRFGRRWGYFGGFLFYWLFWCLLFPRWVLGPGRIRWLFQAPPAPLGDPAWQGGLCLSLPLVLGYGYAFPRALPEARPGLVLGSAAFAAGNGVCEEILWRGTYQAAFPDNVALNTVYPALGFGLWHMAPQTVVPNRSPGGSVSYVAVASIVGLLWATVVRRTGSIRWTTLAHVLFDFSGLGARSFRA